MTTAHATPALLAEYAAGALSEGMGLIVASHLSFCPDCRADVARMEAIGGALLAAGARVAASPGCLAGALARLDEPAAAAPAPARGNLPAPLRERLGSDLADVRWRFLLPGLSQRRLPGFGREDVRLMRGRPGVRILQHTHEGGEATLVLAGELSDRGRVYRRGDLALADADDEHTPTVVGAETCVCLMVFGGPMRFTGRFGRALNILQRRSS